MGNCIFCKIIAGTAPGYIVDQDDDLIVFLSKSNHPLISPKKHIVDIFSMDDETIALIAKKSIQIARALKEGLNCDGVYVTQTNGAAAGQDVFHYHMHLYPKWEDGRILGIEDSDREELAELLRTHFG